MISIHPQIIESDHSISRASSLRFPLLKKKTVANREIWTSTSDLSKIPQAEAYSFSMGLDFLFDRAPTWSPPCAVARRNCWNDILENIPS